MKTPKLRLGIHQTPIKEQLAEQGITISDEDVDKFEKMVTYTHYLYLNRVMTKAIKDDIIKRMMIQLTTLVNMDELIKDMSVQLEK